MSYLEPQSWSDVDSAGTALDWTTRKDKLLYPGYEMLRLALVERCEASGTSVPAVLNTARAPGRIYTGDWFSNFHSTISTLIPLFVDHTDNGGNWNGVSLGNLAPVWSEADILTEIGDASRVSALDIPLAEWSLQQYKILNKLLWVGCGAINHSSYGKASIGLSTWPLAVAAYNACPWTPRVSGFASDNGYGAHDAGPSFWRVAREKCTWKTNAVYAISCRADWYAYISTDGAWSEHVFDDEGMGFLNNTYWGWEFNQSFGPGVPIISNFPTSRADPPPYPGGNSSRESRGWFTEYGPTQRDYQIVIKFNVTGGFKFVA